jgi:exopolysaccharide production protein ExoZ
MKLMTDTHTRFSSIQSLRGIAALMVMIFHLNNNFTVGATGVEIFFVISGFIMGTIGLKEGAIDFLLKRTVRIIPLYWIVTLAICALSLVPGAFSNFKFDWNTLSKSLFFIPYYDQTGHIWPLVVQGWTLNLEIVFYLIFAIGLWTRRPFLACFVTLSIMGLLSAASWRGAIPNFYFTTSWFEFLAGLALSQMWRFIPKWSSPALIVVGITGLGTTQFFKFDAVPVQELFWGFCATSLVAGTVVVEQKIGWPTIMKPFERIGDWSFSLYLLHTFPIHAMYKIFGLTIFSAVGAALISLIASCVSFNVIEKKFGHFLRKNLLMRARL